MADTSPTPPAPVAWPPPGLVEMVERFAADAVAAFAAIADVARQLVAAIADLFAALGRRLRALHDQDPAAFHDMATPGGCALCPEAT